MTHLSGAEPGSLQATLDSLIGAEADGTILAVEKLQKRTKGFERNEIVKALKDLQKRECGLFVAGRRGQPSRFIVKKAQGSRVPENNVSTDLRDAEKVELKHVLVLRQSPALSIVLPFDLTGEEANTIVRWVQALPTG